MKEKTLADRDLPNFHRINDDLYRGGQPTPAGVKKLAAMGIKTVVSFRDTQSKVLREKRLVEENGLRFLNLRLSNWFAARDAEIHKIIEIIRNPENHPVFIHCKRGADRTGTVAAVYRMRVDGWTATDANREAKRHGIGWWQVWMKDYIKAYYRRMSNRIEGKTMNEKFIEIYQTDTLEAFRNYKKMAERAIEQITDEEYFKSIDAESNSIATIVKHLGGNLRSRWTDFLTSDGEKPDRDRDSEFVTDRDTRESLTALWETGWRALSTTLEALTADDFDKTVKIRGEDYTVVKAMNRALAHTAYHVGQITFLAKHFRGAQWETLSIPRGASNDFNAYLAENKNQSHFLEAARKFAEKEKK
jgi:protein tyrosine/serine phosphatase